MNHILFVDDEPLVLRGLERSLSVQADEWHMTFVSGGKEALAQLASAPCDIIVTDMRMPVMNGAQLLGEVMRRYPGVARIVLSGQADQELVLQCVTTAHQYLSKPCEESALIAAVRGVLDVQAVMRTPSLRSLVAGLDRIPSCPDLYHKINAALVAPNVELDDIGAIVQRDIGMTAKLLKVVNSAFFGLSQQVDNAAEAVSYLGVEVLKALVLTAQFFDYSQGIDRAGLSREKLWRQSELTAAVARSLARIEKQSWALQENAFTAGMLHNCGLLVLAENMPERMNDVIAKARESRSPLAAFERLSYGGTHAEVGGYFLGLWGLPHSIVQAVALYPMDAMGVSQPFGTLTLVHAAHALVEERIQTVDGVPNTPLNLDWLRELGLIDHVPTWREAVAEIIEGPK